MDYLGNHVFGDGTAPPLLNQEMDPVQCDLCNEQFEWESIYTKNGKYEHIKTINKIVCKNCLQENPRDLLELLHHVAKINPYTHKKECLALNKELADRRLLNFPVYPYLYKIKLEHL